MQDWVFSAVHGAPLCTFALNTDTSSHERWWNKSPESCSEAQNIISIFFVFFFPPYLHSCFSAWSNKTIKERMSRSAGVPNEWWSGHFPPVALQPGRKTHSSRKLTALFWKPECFFFFWKKPDVTFHVLIRLFITSPFFPWVHNSTTMQSRGIVCVWFWICVCCIHKKQLCTWALF